MGREFWLFTNRNIMVFDDDGNQDADAQTAVSCYDIDPERAQKVLDSCEHFFLACFKQWNHAVKKKEIEYLLGLRTRERDLREL